MGKKYKKIVIGFDQSYTRTGISIAADGKLIMVKSTDFKGCESRSSKRNLIRSILGNLIVKSLKNASEVAILCERIGTFRTSFGNKKNQGGTNPNYFKMTGALIATIVDKADEFNIQVHSVDTRSWKSKIVGSAKAKVKKGKRDAKGQTVEFVEGLGFDLFIRAKKSGKNKGEPIYDDDAADSACIALYGFLPKKDQLLLLEE